MYKVFLVNMPFASVYRPALGITQLKARLDDEFGDKISTEILYINQEYARFLGLKIYNQITNGSYFFNGFGDWLFRLSAFPNSLDNMEEYFDKFYPDNTLVNCALKVFAQHKRSMLDALLNDLITEYQLDQANLVGFTSMFNQNLASFAMARKLKERNPRVVTVIGGANCEANMGQEIVRQVECIDFVFSGPSLISFPTFVRYILNNQIDECHHINGVFSKLNQQVINLIDLNKRSLAVANLGDEFDINTPLKISYSSFLNALEKNFPDGTVEPALLFETSRGCWWGEISNCTFCGLNGKTMNYRTLTPDNAIKQFQFIFEYYPKVTKYECVDNIMPKNYISQVFPYINTPKEVSIFYEVKTDLNEEDMQILRNARILDVQPGIESFSSYTLRLMKKGATAFSNIIFLKRCIVYGLRPFWNLLIGSPGEGEEVYEKYMKDLPLLTHLYPPAIVGRIGFDRFSPYQQNPRSYGLKLKPHDFYSFVYPFNEESLTNIAYYFTDINKSADYYAAANKWISLLNKSINAWRSFWYAQNDNLTHPKLFFKDDSSNSTVIHDSRSGKIVHYDVGEIGKKLLIALEKPSTIAMLIKKFPEISDCEKEVGLLYKQGLVFHEGDRYLNLANLKEPSTMLIDKSFLG